MLPRTTIRVPLCLVLLVTLLGPTLLGMGCRPRKDLTTPAATAPEGGEIAPELDVCLGRDQVAAETTTAIEETGSRLLDQLVAGEFEALYDTGDPELRSAVSEGEWLAFGASMPWDLVDLAEAELFEVWIVEASGGAGDVFPCEPRETDGGGVTVRGVHGLPAAHLAYAISGDPFSHQLDFSLLHRDGVWQLANLHLGLAGFGGKDGAYYLARAEEFVDDGRGLAANLCAKVAVLFGFSGNNIHDPVHAQALALSADIERSGTYRLEMGNWVVGETGHDLYQVGIVTTRSDLSARIGYHSFAGTESDAIKAEAAQLHDHLELHYREIAEEFSHVVWDAYAEPPLDPDKPYTRYTVPLPLTPPDAP